MKQLYFKCYDTQNSSTKSMLKFILKSTCSWKCVQVSEKKAF